jgi:hypothetical protein
MIRKPGMQEGRNYKRWKNGRMEEWKNGRVEEWKNGIMG